MGSVWLKIKVWTKIIVFGLLLLYVLFFVINNDDRVTPWLWFGKEPETSILILILFTFLLGILAAILFRTTFTTLRQLRELKQRGRSEKLEREVAEMRTKASMLRSRPTELEAPGADITSE